MFPTAYPPSLSALLFLSNYCPAFLFCSWSTALHVLEKHAQIVKHRGLQACPQAGCTVTHHSILWIGLFILHFPQLLCCSAVYSAQDIKPTAANQNRIRIKLSVVKLAREHDQGTWKDATGKISSFTISWVLCHKISLGLIIPDSNVFLPPYLSMKILCTFFNSLTAAPAKSSFLLVIQGTLSRQWLYREPMPADWEQHTALVKTGLVGNLPGLES